MTDSQPPSTTPTPPSQRTGRRSRPVRVLIVDTAIAFGGTLVVARNLMTHLDPTVVEASLASACSDGFVSKNFAGGAQIQLISPSVSYVELAAWKRSIRKRFRFVLLRRGMELFAMIIGLLLNVGYVARLIRLYRKLNLDLVHVNNYAMEPLWAARILRIPIVYHLHGFLSAPMDGSGRRNLRHVAAFVSVSKAVTASAVLAGIDRARIHQIANFVDHVSEDAPPPLPAEPAIGIFGRVTAWKGQKEFLAAALKLLPAFKDLVVYVVGDASDGDPAYFDECREIAGASRYSDRIRFAGLVTDVISYYRRCTVVVHASIEPEPFGMVLIEAMAQARPVVASLFGAPSEIIQDGVDGYLVDPRDAHAVSSRISELLSDPNLATNMGLNGRKKIASNFDPRAAAKRFEQLYSEVVNPTDLRAPAPRAG